MSDEIEPAMTAEEWASIPAEWESGAEEEEAQLRSVSLSYTTGTLCTGELTNPFTPEQLIALLNHALPAGHPLKITRLDIVRLREASGGLEDAGAPQLGAALAGLAAKLAALLPPEGT